jgi:hypothetical protein
VRQWDLIWGVLPEILVRLSGDGGCDLGSVSMLILEHLFSDLPFLNSVKRVLAAVDADGRPRQGGGAVIVGCCNGSSTALAVGYQ